MSYYLSEPQFPYLQHEVGDVSLMTLQQWGRRERVSHELTSRFSGMFLERQMLGGWKDGVLGEWELSHTEKNRLLPNHSEPYSLKKH